MIVFNAAGGKTRKEVMKRVQKKAIIYISMCACVYVVNRGLIAGVTFPRSQLQKAQDTGLKKNLGMAYIRSTKSPVTQSDIFLTKINLR